MLPCDAFFLSALQQNAVLTPTLLVGLFRKYCMIYNCNWTEWSTVWSEIIRVIIKSDERAGRVRFEITSMISDQNCTTRFTIITHTAKSQSDFKDHQWSKTGCNNLKARVVPYIISQKPKKISMTTSISHLHWFFRLFIYLLFHNSSSRYWASLSTGITLIKMK